MGFNKDILCMLCSDMEGDLQLLSIPRSEDSILLCISIIVLQRHHCVLPYMLLWLPKPKRDKLCEVS